MKILIVAERGRASAHYPKAVGQDFLHRISLEQIEAWGPTRLSGLDFDLILLQGVKTKSLTDDTFGALRRCARDGAILEVK